MHFKEAKTASDLFIFYVYLMSSNLSFKLQKGKKQRTRSVKLEHSLVYTRCSIQEEILNVSMLCCSKWHY